MEENMFRRAKSYHFLSVPALFAVLVMLLACETGEVLAKSKKGLLGVSVRELTPSMRDEMKLGNRTGLLIINVVPGSPADDAGLREDDVIIKYDGKTVEKIDDFVKMVKNTAPETSLKIDIVRDGEDKTVEATIAKKTSKKWRYFGMGDEGGKFIFLGDRPRLGVQVHEMNKDLADYFQGTEAGGVLVLKVFEDSPAEKGGLKAGDVILKVEDNKVSSPEDLIDVLADFDAGNVVSVEYVRKGAPGKTEVELEDPVEIGWGDFERFVPRIHPRVEWHNFDHDRGIEDMKIIIENRSKENIEI
jgi:S1-C subfamily serine protease